MKILDLLPDKETDNIVASVPAGSFVVPKDVPVKLTEGEQVIPPDKVPVVDAKVKAAGGNGIQDLAPQRYTVNNRDLTWDEYKTGYTESQLRGKKEIPQVVVPQAKNAKYLNQTAPVRFNNDGSITNLDNMQELETGGFVNPQLDENGEPIEPLQPVNTNPTVVDANTDLAQQNQRAAQASEAYLNKDIADMQNNNPQIPISQGNDRIDSDTEKIKALFDVTVPKFDEARAERLKKVAASNAIGQTLSSAITGLMARKTGAPVVDTRTGITSAALDQYNKMLAEDKGYKYQAAIGKTSAAMEGIKEKAANEAANARYNNQLLANTQNLINKFKLDKYARDEEYRRRADELTMKWGFTLAELAKKNEYDQNKTIQEANLRMKQARYEQGQMNYRAKLNNPNGANGQDVMQYFDPNDGTTKTVDRSKALWVVQQAVSDPKNVDDSGRPLYKVSDFIVKGTNGQYEVSPDYAAQEKKYGGSYSNQPLGPVYNPQFNDPDIPQSQPVRQAAPKTANKPTYKIETW